MYAHDTLRDTAPLTHSIASTCRLLDVGRTTVCEMISSGELESLRIGRRRLITDAGIRRLIADRIAESGKAAATTESPTVTEPWRSALRARHAQTAKRNAAEVERAAKAQQTAPTDQVGDAVASRIARIAGQVREGGGT